MPALRWGGVAQGVELHCAVCCLLQSRVFAAEPYVVLLVHEHVDYGVLCGPGIMAVLVEEWHEPVPLPVIHRHAVARRRQPELSVGVLHYLHVVAPHRRIAAELPLQVEALQFVRGMAVVHHSGPVRAEPYVAEPVLFQFRHAVGREHAVFRSKMALHVVLLTYYI